MMSSIPLNGSTLVVGPSNVGKTRHTAWALERWIDEHGSSGVVVFDFAPELERDGQILGGRLTRFTTIPDDAFHGVIEARAPRAESDTAEEAMELAQINAEHAAKVLSVAPENPAAVFVNDATISLQTDSNRVSELLRYCTGASVAVLNAFESDELGTEGQVSQNERAALAQLREWADRVVELS